MITPTLIENHAERAKARLPSFLQNAPNLGKLIDVLAERHQNVEGALFALLTKRALSNADGVQLDQLGTILDLARLVGQPDTPYRIALQGRAVQLGRSGTAEVLIQAYKAIWQANSVLLADIPSSTVELVAFVTTDPGPDPELGDTSVVATMDKVKAGGVQLILEVAQEPAFLWGDAALANGSGELSESPHGFGNATDADAEGNLAPGEGGGNYARVLE